ncbi:MAG: BtpA/SgcQ family protein [Bacillota bacterium]
MERFQSVFGVSKPIIGMIHLLALPGSPNYKGDGLAHIVEAAVRDATRLKDGGVDAILVENYRDYPFKPATTDPETVASMTAVIKEISREVNLPIGVQILRNSAISGLAVAHATGSQFMRVNVLVEAMATDQGIIQGCAHDLLRYRKSLGAEHILILADVHSKHAAPIGNRPVEESAKDTAHRGMADALIISGARTGAEPDIDKLRRVRNAVPDTPIVIGSGFSRENAKELFKYANGAIVGTSLKEGGVTENPVDESRVKNLMSFVRSLR